MYLSSEVEAEAKHCRLIHLMEMQVIIKFYLTTRPVSTELGSKD